MTSTLTCPVCGYTRGYADNHSADDHSADDHCAAARHARHSCDKQLRRTAAAAARAAARITRACEHPRARHQHGTRTAYVGDRCRCQPCTEANARASKDNRRQRAHGRDRYSDTAPVRAHLLALRANGIGLRRLAQLTGLSEHNLRRLTSNNTHDLPHRVRTTTANKIHQVQPTEANRAGHVRVDAADTHQRLHDLIRRGWTTQQIAADLAVLPHNLTRTLTTATVATERRVHALHARLTALTPRQAAVQQRRADLARAPRRQVDARGSRRRLQALMRLGWTPTGLTTHLGMRASRFQQLHASSRVTLTTADRIDDLYERISHSGPPETTEIARAAAQATRDHARHQGWLAPLAWDDIDNDPDPGPSAPNDSPRPDDDIDEVAVERAINGGLPLGALTVAEQDEAVRRLTENGRSLRDIAEQLATTSRNISRRRLRLRTAA